jgi:RNA polymerase sigma-70 factor (ECF subfamily)
LGPWIHRITVNRALDWLRSERRQPESAPDPEQLETLPPTVLSEAPQANAHLLNALGLLSPEDRAMVMLRHVLSYRSNEIGDIVGMPAATVRTRLARAMKRLRAELESKDQG